MMTIAERLKEARLRTGLTIPAVAEKTKLSVGNLSDLENGKHDPSAKALLLLSELYQVSTDWILKGETSGQPAEDLTEEFKGFQESLGEAWKEADIKTKGWFLVQLRKAFPEINPKRKE